MTARGGLAAERTSLAWTRSALAVGAIAAAVAKAGEQAGELELTVVAVAVLTTLAVLVWLTGSRVDARRAGGAPPERRTMMLLPAATTISAAAAIAIAVLT